MNISAKLCLKATKTDKLLVSSTTLMTFHKFLGADII